MTADTVHEPEHGKFVPIAKPYLDAEAVVFHMHHSVDWLGAGLPH